MINDKDVQEILPFPIKLVICCDGGEFRSIVGNSLNEILRRHNEGRDSLVMHIGVHYVTPAFEDENLTEDELGWNDYAIYVGKELVYLGRDKFKLSESNLENYYLSIMIILEGVIDANHDKIIALQEKNQAKVDELEAEGYDEMLYAYYKINCDKKSFIYLKKLALRYPNSRYRKRLLNAYEWGWKGHNPNMKMVSKLRSKRKFRGRIEF